MKKTQKQWVLKQLNEYGEVRRNQALQNNITRLSAIILNLKNEGYKIEGDTRAGDYVYTLGEKPAPKKKPTYQVIDLPNGQRVARMV